MLAFYISPNLSVHQYGGAVVAHSNLQALQAILGISVTPMTVNRYACADVIKLANSESRLGTLLSHLMLLSATTLKLRGFLHLIRMVRKQKPDFVWFDSSCFGVLSWLIKIISPKTKVYVFFQNIEKNMIKMEIRSNLINILKFPAVALNESLSIRYADRCLAITESVARHIRSVSQRTGVDSISIGRRDDFVISERPSPYEFDYILFVGSDFPPNVSAVKFLDQKLAGRLDNLKIVVVGSGMEKHANKFTNVVIAGSVDDISLYYQHARKVVAPLISGDGMKIKIAEALMFGKTVVATPFAAVGYEEMPSFALQIAEGAAKFMSLLLQPSPLYDENIRRLWLDNYSQEALSRKIGQVVAHG